MDQLSSLLITPIAQRVQLHLKSPRHTLNDLVSYDPISYPFLGISYFFNHPRLWPLYLKTILPSIIIQLSIFLLTFSILFPFNISSSVLYCGPPLGILIGINLTLQESNFLTNYILSNYLIPKPMNDLFDFVLCNEGLYHMVVPGKLRRQVPMDFSDYIMEEFIKFPIYTLPRISINTIVRLALFSIPIVGPIYKTYKDLNNQGLNSQQRYFKLNNFRKEQVTYINKEKKGELVTFAFVSNLLLSIPLPLAFSFFNFTNQIGAALMCVDYYKNNDFKDII